MSSGLALLTYISLNRPNRDVCRIVIDIPMHVINGIQKLVTIKADMNLPAISAVLFSNTNDGIDRLIATSLHTPILPKPGTVGEMGYRIREMLELVNRRR
ncbi:hypothetical protein [Flaviaesturariibacter amylovorans]|uniref:Response regulator n=1 Tax=Flaviaesturariibacter amylovorans TaxID=1084520 RepID=A0ABP8GXN7_9BACT